MRGVIRSELTKFFSYPWCVIGTIAAILTAPVLLLVMKEAEVLSVQDVLATCMRALILGQIGIVVAAAGLFGQEYEQSCLRTTFLGAPNRLKTVGAKWIVMTAVTVFAGITSDSLSLAIGIIQSDFDITFRLIIGFAASVALTLISWVQLAWISAGLTMLTKTLIAPIAILLPLIFGLSQMLYSFFSPAKFLPDLATINLFLVPKASAFLDVWPGIAVQCTWMLLLGTTGILLTLHRDVR